MSIEKIKELLDNMPNEEFLELHRSVEKGIGPTVEEYYSNFDYIKYRGKCKEFSEELCENDPELILTRGYFHESLWGKDEKQAHWWCKYPNGRIVDPTVKQFPSWKMASTNPEMFYEEFDGMCECAECGKKIKEEDAKFDSRYAFCSSACNMRFVGL